MSPQLSFPGHSNKLFSYISNDSFQLTKRSDYIGTHFDYLASTIVQEDVASYYEVLYCINFE